MILTKYANNEMVFYFIETDSVFYNQVIGLRHKVFFQPLGMSKNIIFDNLENSSMHLIALLEDKVIGYVRLTIAGNKGQISQMVVDPLYQGKGIGGKLILKIIDKAIEFKVKQIFLEARLPALHFYQKFGFIPVGEEFPSKKTGLPHRQMVRSVMLL